MATKILTLPLKAARKAGLITLSKRYFSLPASAVKLHWMKYHGWYKERKMDNTWKTQNLNSPDANHTDASVLGAEPADVFQDESPLRSCCYSKTRRCGPWRSSNSRKYSLLKTSPPKAQILMVPLIILSRVQSQSYWYLLITSSIILPNDNSTYDTSAELKNIKILAHHWNCAIITSVGSLFYLLSCIFIVISEIVEGTKQIKHNAISRIAKP